MANESILAGMCLLDTMNQGSAFLLLAAVPECSQPPSADLPKRLSSASQPPQRMDEMDDATRRMQENWLCSGGAALTAHCFFRPTHHPASARREKLAIGHWPRLSAPLHPRRVIRAGVDPARLRKKSRQQASFFGVPLLRCGEVGSWRLASHFPRPCLPLCVRGCCFRR